MNKCLKYKLLDNILWVISMFKPKALYCENNIENYVLGRELLEKYSDVPRVMIDNHNNIEEMRKKQNKDFADMKRNLIIGVRKTHKFVPIIRHQIF